MPTKLLAWSPLALLGFAAKAWAAQEAGGYLRRQDPAPALADGASVSASSTFFDIFSLLLVFGLVLLLAYLASRFIGSRFAPKFALSGNVFYSMPLDHNKRIVFVEMAGSVLVLGVTEHNVSLLKEVAGAEEIERLKGDLKDREGMLRHQSKTLDGLQKKIKPMLRNLSGGKKETL